MFSAKSHELPPAPVHIGALAAHFYNKFQSRLDKGIPDAESRKAGKRSAANTGARGHQKTPGFIISLARDVIRTIDAEEVPGEKGPPPWDQPPFMQSKPGFTDVGLHTGGQPRDTTWGLVKSVFYNALMHEKSRNSRLQRMFLLIVAHFELRLAETELSSTLPLNCTRIRCDTLMQMLVKAATNGATLSDIIDAETEGDDKAVIDRYRQRCDAFRLRLDELTDERARAAAQKFVLPEKPTPATTANFFDLPVLNIPARPLAVAEALSYEQIREEALKNLSWRPLPPLAPCISTLLKYTQDTSRFQGNLAEDYASQQLLLRAVENHLFGLAANLPKTEWAHTSSSSLSRIMLSPTEIDKLVALVESYRLQLHEFQKTKTAGARMQVEMRSREALVVWVAYCLTYHAVGA
jgi:hypothetical protein